MLKNKENIFGVWCDKYGYIKNLKDDLILINMKKKSQTADIKRDKIFLTN